MERPGLQPRGSVTEPPADNRAGARSGSVGQNDSGLDGVWLASNGAVKDVPFKLANWPRRDIVCRRLRDHRSGFH